jgi:hypothetical protein
MAGSVLTLRTAALAAWFAWPTPIVAGVSRGIDEEARLPYWEVAEPDVAIRLVQRLPDQTRGFFQARGFPVPDAERIAQSCVFQTIFRNTSRPADPGPIEYDLREWVVRTAAGRQNLKTREDWAREWKARGAPKAAQLAFEWALLPTRQTYGPGDYNWGMSVFNLAPGAEFDLDVVWRQRGERRSVRLTGVQCAPDVEIPPATP